MIPSDSNLDQIGKSAFCDSTVSGTLHIPSDMQTIKEHAFDNCPRLKSIVSL